MTKDFSRGVLLLMKSQACRHCTRGKIMADPHGGRLQNSLSNNHFNSSVIQPELQQRGALVCGRFQGNTIPIISSALLIARQAKSMFRLTVQIIYLVQQIRSFLTSRREMARSQSTSSGKRRSTNQHTRQKCSLLDLLCKQTLDQKITNAALITLTKYS